GDAGRGHPDGVGAGGAVAGAALARGRDGAAHDRQRPDRPGLLRPDPLVGDRGLQAQPGDPQGPAVADLGADPQLVPGRARQPGPDQLQRRAERRRRPWLRRRHLLQHPLSARQLDRRPRQHVAGPRADRARRLCPLALPDAAAPGPRLLGPLAADAAADRGRLPALHDVPPAQLGRHLPRADPGPRRDQHPARDPAPDELLQRGAAGAGRGGDARRAEPVRRLLAGRPPVHPRRPGGDRDPHLRLLLERVLALAGADRGRHPDRPRRLVDLHHRLLRRVGLPGRARHRQHRPDLRLHPLRPAPPRPRPDPRGREV
ncbi:MAG: hypothetical protein AVDCRST_MAG49-892, partial [uncultured Thermomicrobiales bacterium]